MSSSKYLPFIDDDILVGNVKKILDVVLRAECKASAQCYKNVVDPFSALFDAARQGISLTEWLKQEKSRQVQKTFQNALGRFHQEIIGAMPGWKSLGTGKVVDVANESKGVIAEIKNKFNTTKGTDKKAVYDNLKSCLEGSYRSCKTGYYVEIIAKSKKPYDKPFTPSDNVTKERRELDERIRVIDGKSFYGLASGYPEALKMLYEALPGVIGTILGNRVNQIKTDKLFSRLFEMAYASVDK